MIERYCTAPVRNIGNDHVNGHIGFLCYMLWDIFVLYPGNSSAAMMEESVGVMDSAIHSQNDQCITSAIHSLGHWVREVHSARRVLNRWLRSPTTTNAVVIDYAKIAKTGYIL
ncbi:hypothetical protein [Aeoliella mucimassa]|uniref:hypothetical protein n=1 Tax=Aeoliella mucimassa TaxID=2527972 RepID=UPI00119F2458|nr:hypothetical protein [Aeoliella mucimassa]